MAGMLAAWLELDRKASFMGEVDEKIRALTLAEVNAALKRHVDPKKLSTVKVGDFKRIAPPGVSAFRA
jgi:zinc protease